MRRALRSRERRGEERVRKRADLQRCAARAQLMHAAEDRDEDFLWTATAIRERHAARDLADLLNAQRAAVHAILTVRRTGLHLHA